MSSREGSFAGLGGQAGQDAIQPAGLARTGSGRLQNFKAQALAGHRRGEHMKLGFALQLVTVRWLGIFLEDPLDVPATVVDFVAAQLEVADPSQVKRYTGRTKTRFDHQWEIRRACKLKEFTDVETEFADWVAARSWTSGDGPKAIFLDGMAWLRERKVLLPGVTTLARLVQLDAERAQQLASRPELQ